MPGKFHAVVKNKFLFQVPKFLFEQSHCMKANKLAIRKIVMSIKKIDRALHKWAKNLWDIQEFMNIKQLLT